MLGPCLEQFAARLLHFAEQTPQVALLRSEERLGALQPLARQAEPAAERDRLATAGRPRQEVKRRMTNATRAALEITGRRELHRRAGGAIELERRSGQLGQVGGDDTQRPALEQRLEKGDRERRALVRIGARAELVEKQQARRSRRLPGFLEAQQASAEGRAVGEQILLVAHRGDQPGERRQAGAGSGRHRQPALVHQRQEPDRLEGHGLAAGVGAGDDQHATFPAELDVERHDVALMAGLPERGWRADRRRRGSSSGMARRRAA